MLGIFGIMVYKNAFGLGLLIYKKQTMALTPEYLAQIISNAGSIIQDSIEKAKNSSTAQVVKDELTQNANVIQNLLNAILNSAGAVTQDQINQLDYQVRMQKMKMLELNTQQTKKKYTIIIGSVILGIAVLFYLTRKKQ
jgi:hypothetical protein